MRKLNFWLLVGSVPVSCAIPDVELVSSLDPAGGGTSGTSGVAHGGAKAGSPADSNSAAGADNGGEPSGGKTVTATAGTAAVGDAGASGTGAAGTGGSTATPTPEMAVAKFCNPLAIDAADKLDGQVAPGLAVDLEIGSDEQKVTLSTQSYQECALPAGQACQPVPVGSAVPFRLVHHKSGIELARGVANIKAGDAVLFTAAYYQSGTQYYQVRVEQDATRFDVQGCRGSDYNSLFRGATGATGATGGAG